MSPSRTRSAFGSAGCGCARGHRLPALAGLCLLAVMATEAAAQRSSPDRLAAGKLLVAAEKLSDPNFSESVVLLLEHGEQGSLGVILNRPTALSLATAFPDIAALEESEDPVFVGGPVAPTGMLVVLRSAEEAEGDRLAFDDLYWSGSRDRLEQLAGEGESANFRVFAGHAGWAPRQLAGEVERGDWHILPATMEEIYDPAPLDLWFRLMRRVPQRWANVSHVAETRVAWGLGPSATSADGE